jgi:predicted dehydrogenase
VLATQAYIGRRKEQFREEFLFALKMLQEGQATRTVKPEGTDGYVEQLRYLVGCIQAGTRPTVVTARDGLSAVEICEAEEKSVQTGLPVNLLALTRTLETVKSV